MLTEQEKELVVNNLKLVPKIAWKYSKSGMPMDDLIQFGNEGLIRASQKYKEEKGLFSTYAWGWISSKMRRGLLEKDTLHCPVHVADDISMVRAYSVRYKLRHGEYPTEQHIKSNVNIAASRLKNALIYMNTSTVPIDHNTKTEDRSCGMIDELMDSEVPTPFDLVEDKEVINKSLGCLTPKERFVIEKRYLNEKSLESIGHLLYNAGMSDHVFTKEWVRRIELKALAKMRKAV